MIARMIGLRTSKNINTERIYKSENFKWTNNKNM